MRRARRAGCVSCPRSRCCGRSGCSSTTATARGEGDPAGGRPGRAWPPAGQIADRLPLRHRGPVLRKTRQGLVRVQGPPLRDLHEPAGTVNLITGVATTQASAADAAMTAPVHDMLAAAGLAPGVTPMPDTCADLLLDARRRGITLLGPLPDNSAQARTGGYTTRRSPSTGTTSRSPAPRAPPAAHGPPAGRARETRSWSTSPPPPAGPARPEPVHQLSPPRPAAVPAPPRDPRCRHRRPRCPVQPALERPLQDPAGVEGTISQATHVTGIRRARYLGLPKTRLEHNAAAAALNLIRLDAWWTGKPLDRTRTSHLQRLNLTPAA